MFLKLRLSVFLIMQIFIIITFQKVLFIGCIKITLLMLNKKIFEHITFIFLEPSEPFFQDIQTNFYLITNAKFSFSFHENQLYSQHSLYIYQFFDYEKSC